MDDIIEEIEEVTKDTVDGRRTNPSQVSLPSEILCTVQMAGLDIFAIILTSQCCKQRKVPNSAHSESSCKQRHGETGKRPREGQYHVRDHFHVTDRSDVLTIKSFAPPESGSHSNRK